MGKFYEELKRRKVFNVAAVYAVVAWLLIQISSTILPTFNAPEWVNQTITLLFFLGFPITLIMAWAYEITPEGIKPDSEKQTSHSVVKTTESKLTYIILALVLLVAGFQISDRFAFDLKGDSGTNPQSQAALQVNRFAYQVPENQQFRNQDWNNVMALSPDGRHFFYITNQGLFLRKMGELEARLIPGVVRNIDNAFFSPDSQSIAYRERGNNLMRVGISGGAPEVLSDSLNNIFDADWNIDNTILFARVTGIYRVSGIGGIPELVIEAKEGERLSSPQLLPDGDTVLFSARALDTSWDTAQIFSQSLSSGERTVLVQGGSDPHYLPTGHLIFAFGNNLFGVAFDVNTLTVSGDKTLVVQGVVRGSDSDSANYSVSEDGTLAYLHRTALSQSNALVWIDREGSVEVINAEPRNYQYVQLSPDGTQLALDSRDDENDIWVFDLDRENLQRLSLDPNINRNPLWSPDGRVLFTRIINERQNIYVQAADGTGVARPLMERAEVDRIPSDISSDGTTLFYFVPTNSIDIAMSSLEDEANEGELLLAGPANELNATLSPNGNWLAYQSDESGRYEVYVRPFPDIDSGRSQISTGGGSHPLWSMDGSELFYLVLDENDVFGSQTGTGALMAVSIDSELSFVPGIPELLFQDNFIVPNANRLTYDISADGQRFLMIQNATGDNVEAARNEIIIIQNWTEELKRLIPVF